MSVNLKAGEDYTFLYVMNSKKYRFEFKIDKAWHVKN